MIDIGGNRSTASGAAPGKVVLSSIRKQAEWAGEMAQLLRALAALPKDLGSIPSTLMSVILVPGDLTLLHTYMQTDLQCT